MIYLNEITLLRGQSTLFDSASLTIHSQDKVGLVGLNGSGKSSLLAMILGKLETTLGDITIPSACRIAHLAQDTPAVSDTAIDYVMQGDKTLYDLRLAIQKAEKEGHFENLATLHAAYENIDGYTAHHRAAALLNHLGFSTLETEQAVKSFSGGWRMRLNLAQALFAPSDCLLLDEPTNHLDLETIIWLESFLKAYQGTIILISHDRLFLDNCVDHIAHIHNQKIIYYRGNYSSFERQEAMQAELLEAQADKQAKKRDHMMKLVERFRAKASKAKQAQSRLKAIEKMEIIEKVQGRSPIQFSFFPPKALADPLLTLTKVDMGYGDKILIKGVQFQVLKGDRIGLLGKNGAGKSTFIRSIIGEIPLLEGECRFAMHCEIGYFAQHQLEFLRADLTPLGEMMEHAPGISEQNLRTYLGSFAFSGDKATQKIASLSGGEKARLVLALIIWKKPALLLLDEPTNHLDIEMRMALTLALQNYEGALVLISHDRHLMSTIVDSLFLIADKACKPYEGDIDDYIKMLQTEILVPLESEPKENRYLKQKEIKRTEAKLAKAVEEEKKILVELALPKYYELENQKAYEALLEKKNKIIQSIHEYETLWFALMDES